MSQHPYRVCKLKCSLSGYYWGCNKNNDNKTIMRVTGLYGLLYPFRSYIVITNYKAGDLCSYINVTSELSFMSVPLLRTSLN